MRFELLDDRLRIIAEPVSKKLTPQDIAILVGDDKSLEDLTTDWTLNPPRHIARFRPRTRRQLQRNLVYLRNRRIVSGYEVLDRQLREKLGEAANEVVVTWLGLGKWTARAIGDMLGPQRRDAGVRTPMHSRVRRLVTFALPRRTRFVERALVLGNREIFAQVASVISVFVAKNFSEASAGMPFEAFLYEYANDFLGVGDPYLPDELAFQYQLTTRDPLSDSLMRAMHAYFNALKSRDHDKVCWILTGNLYLVAYEQRVAQTFIEIAFSARPRRLITQLFAEQANPSRSVRISRIARARDNLIESGLAVRIADAIASAFATRFFVHLAVGESKESTVYSAHKGVTVDARAVSEMLKRDDPPARLQKQVLHSVRSKAGVYGAATSGLSLGDPHESFQRLWYALDRADADATRTCVKDWRYYPSRMNFIANLFLAGLKNPRVNDPSFPAERLTSYLNGEGEEGVRLSPLELSIMGQSGLPAELSG